jgi:di/tricarboxylate transporter
MDVMKEVNETLALKRIPKMKLYGGFGGVALAILLLLVPLGMDQTAQITFALSAWLLIWLITTPIESGYRALIYIFAMILMGYQPASLFTWFYIAPGWFQISAFVIAAAMMKCGLAKRLAYTLMYRLGANTISRFMLVSILVSFILIIVVPSPTALVAILFPLTIYVAEAWDLPARSEGKKGVPAIALLSFFVVVLCGECASWIKTGFSLNMLTLQLAGTNIEWFEWLKLAGPIVWLSAFLACVLMILVFKPPKRYSAPKEVMKVKVDELGSLKKQEVIVLAIMLVVLVLWTTESYHGLASGWVAMAAILVLCIPQLKIFGSFDEAVKSVNWSVIIFIAGIQALGTCLTASGATAQIAVWISGLKPATETGYYVLSAFMGTFVASILGTNVMQSVIIPILTGGAAEIGVEAANAALAVWLPTVSGPYLLPTLLPATLFAWTFKYKGERLFTMVDGLRISLVLYLGYYVAAALIQLTLWSIL